MFTKRFYLLVEIMCAISCLLGSNCILFHKKKKRFFSFKITRIWIRFTFTWVLGFNLFMIFRTLQVKWTSDDIQKFNECYILTLLWTLGCISLGIVVTRIREATDMLNQLVNFAIDFKNKWVKHYDRKTVMCGDHLDRILVTIIVVCNFLSWLSVVVYSMDTHLPLYPHTILPEFLRDHILVIILVGLLVLYAATTISWLMILLATVGGAYLSCCVPVFTKEFSAGMKSYTTHDGLRRPFVLSLMYRTCEIQHFFFVQTSGIALLPFQVLISQFVLIANYVLICHQDDLKSADKVRLTIITGILQFSWVVVLELAGRYYLNNTKMIKTFKFHKTSNDLESKFLRKYAKSCRPLCIGTPGYFKIRRLTVLKFIRGIVKGTFNTVLAAKGQDAL